MNYISSTYSKGINYVNENLCKPVMESLEKNVMSTSALGLVLINSVAITLPSLMFYSKKGSTFTQPRFLVASVFAGVQALAIVKIFPIVGSTLSAIGLSRPSSDKLPERYQVCLLPRVRDDFYSCLEQSYSEKNENLHEELPQLGRFLAESALSSGVSHVVSFVSGTFLALPCANGILALQNLGRKAPMDMRIIQSSVKNLMVRTGLAAASVLSLLAVFVANARYRGQLLAQ